jgi:hypothetical protein
MKSSYNNNITYRDLLTGIVFSQHPKKIIEFGILEGASLKAFVDSTDSSCEIIAYDIFDEFNGNGANKDALHNLFSNYVNVKIEYGDFYKKITEIPDKSVDIMHIDIANNGDTYEYSIKHGLKKLSQNGILLLEGGSKQRDQVEWMDKYNKPKIQPILEKHKNDYSIITIGDFPSITSIRKK